MPKTPTRFTVRKIKCCYRNSMILGNPIEKTFERFAVYDKLWKNCYGCGLHYDDCKYLMNPRNGEKFRRLCDFEEDAVKAAAEMNQLWINCQMPDHIKFNDWGDVKIVEMKAKSF